MWTCGPKGTLAEWDILFVDGKIEQVAPDITVPQGSAVVIEGAGKHITPGLFMADMIPKMPTLFPMKFGVSEAGTIPLCN